MNISSLEWSWIVFRINLDVLKIIDLVTVYMDQWFSKLLPVEWPGIIRSWGWLKTSVVLWINRNVFEIIDLITVYVDQWFSELFPVEWSGVI